MTLCTSLSLAKFSHPNNLSNSVSNNTSEAISNHVKVWSRKVLKPSLLPWRSPASLHGSKLFRDCWIPWKITPFLRESKRKEEFPGNSDCKEDFSNVWKWTVFELMERIYNRIFGWRLMGWFLRSSPRECEEGEDEAQVAVANPQLEWPWWTFSWDSSNGIYIDHDL